MHFLLLECKNLPIFQALLLEEKLLRLSSQNFCILNYGSPPAIVMGISGKTAELINTEQVQARPCPIIRRFSGGGTVYVEENTLFVSWIGNKKELPFTIYPESLLRFCYETIQPHLPIEGFSLREHDFVIKDKKCGGNAQYLTKDRFLQHTSFLWDFSSEGMKYLLHPPKAPSYRQGRNHEAFLCRLCDLLPDKESLFSAVKQGLPSYETTTPDLLPSLPEACRISTHYIELPIL